MSESTPDLATQAGDELLAELADDFLRRFRTREQPSVDEYAEKHPELADRIRDLFPAVIVMEQPATGATCDFARPTERVSATIGRYKLLERIGEGGFGVVYMAEQQHPVRRKVALKVIKPGIDTQQVIARFEAERQALALMDHENIAKVLDAGATDSGRPYFVMELVHGVPITDFCDHNQLPTHERLALFVQVCRAVQHAHTKGIIHRDIKPTNVLVTLHEGVPVPKVIDFGVAKATGQQLTDKTLFTHFAQIVGTPLYMSPEQAEMTGIDVDTRSDVYSLGVLLYELLTGTTPLDKERLKQAAFDEVRRIIREEEPPTPSTRLSTLGQQARSISARQKSDRKQLGRLMRGELDWIVMKALEKERARRYETASAFAADVARYLSDEPVQACPPSAGYRLRKFVRRHKGPVLAALLILLALVAGVIGTTWGLIGADQARQNAVLAKVEAQKRLAQLEKATEVLATVFRNLDPEAVENEGAALRELLARRMGEAAQQLEGEAVGDPLVVARLQHVLGISLRELGHLEQAERVLVKACQTRERLLGADHLDTAATKHDLAMLYRTQAKYAAAETLYEDVLESRTAKLGPDHPDTLHSQQQLAMLYHSQEKYDLAQSLCEKVLELRTAKLGADHPDTLTSQHRLALVYRSQWKFNEAENLCREVLTRRIASRGSDHLDTLASKKLLAGLAFVQGKPELAEPLYKEVLEGHTAKLGADHPDTLNTQHSLAVLYASIDKLDQSIPLLEQTLTLRKAKLGPAHATTLSTQFELGRMYCNATRLADGIALLEEVHQKRHGNLARVGSVLLGAYLQAGKTTEASALATELLQAARDEFPDDSLQHFAALADAGWTLVQGKVYADAEPFLRESLSRGDQHFPDFWRTHHARLLLGIALLGQQKLAEAEPPLVAGYEALRQREAQIPRDVNFPLTQAVLWVVELYETSQQPNKAAEWRRRLKEGTTGPKES